MSEFDDMIKEFLVESYENLDRLDQDFVILEQEPGNLDRLGSIFRTLHTIKGSCAFLGYAKLERVSHAGESLLSLLRDGRLHLTPEITSALLATVDAVRGMLEAIEATAQEGDTDYGDLIATLHRLQGADGPDAEAHEVEVHADLASESAAPEPEVPEAPVHEVAAPEDCSPVAAVPVATVQAPRPSPVSGVESSAPAPAEDPVALDVAEVVRGKGPGESVGGLTESNIRVDVGLLDKLMNLVGELVLARNQVLQFAQGQKDAAFLGTTQRLNLITTELQENVMKTRMQPIENVWKKFPRVVRDLSLACGKQVKLEMEGKETELDKTLIEAIKDPLTHLLRNSIDHGLETPEMRTRRGKSAEGRLLLRAFHEGGQVNIEISDDGGGINVEKVKAKALERALVTRDQVARMNERDLLQLVFLPGFSTAAAVTNLSGRGVGMDVVKTNIEKIGGTVDLQTEAGRGTLVKIKIPLTLAIIPALIVTAAGDRYAIPQVSLLELVRFESKQAESAIEFIHGAPVYRLRGNLLPLVTLRNELGEPLRPGEGDQEHPTNIVVLQAGEQRFGLVVDGISDTEEIVVKPLGKQLKGVPVFAGATIMGDGRVALILDVLGLAQKAQVVAEAGTSNRATRTDGGADRGSRCQTLLLLGLGRTGRLAIPLSLVARLEEIQADTVEVADGQEVVQYRDQIMPLVRLANVLGVMAEDDGDLLQVVVYSDKGRSVGLVVSRILDIVETALEVKRGSRRGGLLGSAVIQGRVTDLLDLPEVIRSALPECFAESAG